MSSARQRGSAWTAYWRVRDKDGNLVQRTATRSSSGPFRTKRAALQYGQEQESKVRAGTYSEAADKKISIKAFIDNVWLPAMRTGQTASGAPRRATTIAGYETVAKAWIVPYLGGERLVALTPGRVEQWLDELRSRGGKNGKPLGARSVQVAYSQMRAIVDFALKRHYVNRNEVAVVGRPGAAQAQMTAWTAEQAQRFLAAAASVRLYALYVILLTRGLRRGELAGLTWDAIDLDRGVMTITRTRVMVNSKVQDSTPKTRAGRRSIPLDEGLIRVLRQHKDRLKFEARAWGSSWADTGHLAVREDGQPMSPESISQHFDRLCKTVDVPRVRLHDCRHTAASLMLEDGSPVKVVSEMLGHSSPAITNAVYAHVLPGMSEAAGERLSGRLLGGSR